MNIRRKNRLWIACAVLAGLALTIGLVLYALRSNIDLFYTPGEILYGKRETQQMPEVGQRLRVGGMVMPGSVQRDPNSRKKCWRNMMKTTRRQKLRKRWKPITVARRVFIRTQHHDAGNW